MLLSSNDNQVSLMDLKSLNEDFFKRTKNRCIPIKCFSEKRKARAKAARVISALKKCTVSRDLKTGRNIHADLVESGLETSHILVANTLVNMYCKCGSMAEARLVFDKISQKKTTSSWTSMILGYIQSGESELGFDMFSRMHGEGIVLDRAAFLAGLKACSSSAVRGGKDEKLHWLEKGRSIHSQLRKSGVELDNLLSSSLVDMYAKCGSLEEARDVFDGMKQQDVVAWSSMILGYAESGSNELALDLYRRMPKQGCVPNSVTYLAALKACGNLAALEAGKRVASEICNSRLQRDPLVAAVLVDFFGKCGCMEEAREVFECFATKDLITWNALLSGYSWGGDTRAVFEVFDEMIRQRVRPDGVVFLSILTACSQAGLTEKGLEWFRRMSDEYRIVPGLKHYTCVVDLLGRANRLDEALQVLKGMACEPDLRIWMVLLGACHKWSNLEAGKLAFDAVLRFEERHAAAYVLMANICSNSGMNEESELLANEARVRSPGKSCSSLSWWTDEAGVVHRFWN